MTLSDETDPSDSLNRPNIARAYDHLLGGKDNFEADRALAQEMLEAWPRAQEAAFANRRFLQQAVKHIVAQGVTQFLDIGTGLPTENNVHQVAQEANPDARVVYVDYDRVVVTHGNAILRNPNTRMLHADMRNPSDILNGKETLELIDFHKPVATLFLSSLHFITPEEDAHSIVAAFRDAMPPGSYLVIAHGLISDELKGAVQAYNSAIHRGNPRTRAEIEAFFDGLEILEPGLVPLAEWRQGPVPSRLANLPMLAGVGRK